MSNVVYISGQITGLKKTIYEHRFNSAEKHLKYSIIGYVKYSFRCPDRGIVETEYLNSNKKYTSIINPLTIRPLFGIKRWFFYMVADIWVLITKADTIYMLNNYKQSKGAKTELFFAKLFNKKIEYEK